MKNRFCDREQSVAASMRGALDADLLAHTTACPVCSEILLVTDLLRRDSATLVKSLHIADAAVLWKKAQARAREVAIAKATLPIRIVRTCACIFAFVAAARLIMIEFSKQPAWLPNLGLKHFLDASLLATLTSTTALAVFATIVFLGVSSWIALRQE